MTEEQAIPEQSPRLKLADLDEEAFYTPEFIAPIMGFTKTELRRYAKESNIHTRLSKKRIMLTVQDVRDIKAWLLKRREKAAEWWNEPERDPFS
jgi:hypothetical protein